MSDKDDTPRIYFIMGAFFLLIFGFTIFVAYMAEAAPTAITYISFAMMIMSFSLSYLYPHLKVKDERARMIRQKGMYYTYFALLIYFAILMTILEFDVVFLTASDVLHILFALTVSTVFISQVILAKTS